MGSADRAVRFVLGVLLLGLYGALDPPLRYVTLIGLLFVGTALTGVCPLYLALGLRTDRLKGAE
jgi:hydrogenase/urease accessory protein HupE